MESFEISPAVIILWWATLAVTVVVFVPLAWYLLHRTWKAARSIRRYTSRALEAGAGIAENTAAIGALDDTLSVAEGLVETGAQVGDQAGTLRDALLRRAGTGGGR